MRARKRFGSRRLQSRSTSRNRQRSRGHIQPHKIDSGERSYDFINFIFIEIRLLGQFAKERRRVSRFRFYNGQVGKGESDTPRFDNFNEYFEFLSGWAKPSSDACAKRSLFLCYAQRGACRFLL